MNLTRCGPFFGGYVTVRGPLHITAEFNHDQSCGAAVMLCFLTTLFTISGKKSFTLGEIVNVLDLIGKRELPEGLIDTVKDVADRLNG